MLCGVVVAAAVACLLGGCCAADSSTLAKTATTSAAPVTAALPHGTVHEDLSFSGDLAGRLDAARHGNVYTCGGLGSIYIVDPIVGNIGGKSYELGIRITGYKGPGKYQMGGELTPGSGVAAIGIWVRPEGTQDASSSKTGSVAVNADGRSGTMDADLAGKLGAFHVAGTWTCPPEF